MSKESVEKQREQPSPAAEQALNNLDAGSELDVRNGGTKEQLKKIRTEIEALRRKDPEKVIRVRAKIVASLDALKKEQKEKAHEIDSRLDDLEEARLTLTAMNKAGVPGEFSSAPDFLRTPLRIGDSFKNQYIEAWKENPWKVGSLTAGAAIGGYVVLKWLFGKTVQGAQAVGGAIGSAAGTGFNYAKSGLTLAGGGLLTYFGFRQWAPDSWKKWMRDNMPTDKMKEWWEKEMGLTADSRGSSKEVKDNEAWASKNERILKIGDNSYNVKVDEGKLFVNGKKWRVYLPFDPKDPNKAGAFHNVKQAKKLPNDTMELEVEFPANTVKTITTAEKTTDLVPKLVGDKGVGFKSVLTKFDRTTGQQTNNQTETYDFEFVKE